MLNQHRITYEMGEGSVRVWAGSEIGGPGLVRMPCKAFWKITDTTYWRLHEQARFGHESLIRRSIWDEFPYRWNL